MRKDDSAIRARILSEKTAYEGDFLAIQEVSLCLPNGDTAVHEIVRHPGAAAMLAIDENDNVLVVRQYRTALDRIFTEIPAGKLDPGENPEVAASRELAEETGVQADTVTSLFSLTSAIGFCDEIIHIFLATGLRKGKPNLDEDEFVETDWIPYPKLLKMIQTGEIIDGKTVASVLFYEANCRRSA